MLSSMLFIAAAEAAGHAHDAPSGITKIVQDFGIDLPLILAQSVNFIVVAKQLGFSLAEIRRLIETSKRGAPTGKLARRIVEKRVIEIRSQIDALRELQTRMETALSVWDDTPERLTEAGSICSVIELVSAQVNVTERSTVVEIGCRLPSCRHHEAEARAVGD